MFRKLFSAALVLLVVLWRPAAVAAFEHAVRPFMLWNATDAAAARQWIETEPWARAEYERMLKDDDPLGKTIRNLFRYAVMRDTAAGETEKDYLLKIIGTHPSQHEKLDQDGRHYDCYLDALRFDTLHALLSPE